MTENEIKQQEMQNYYTELLNVILAEGKTGLLPTLAPKLINCNYEEKSITIEVKVNEWQLNPEGILFGGLTVSMLDASYGLLCHYFAGDRFISTISENTIFLKPGKLNDIIHVKVNAVSNGRTIINMCGEAYNVTKSELMATSQTSFMILDKKVKL